MEKQPRSSALLCSVDLSVIVIDLDRDSRVKRTKLKLQLADPVHLWRQAATKWLQRPPGRRGMEVVGGVRDLNGRSWLLFQISVCSAACVEVLALRAGVLLEYLESKTPRLILN